MFLPIARLVYYGFASLAPLWGSEDDIFLVCGVDNNYFIRVPVRLIVSKMPQSSHHKHSFSSISYFARISSLRKAQFIFVGAFAARSHDMPYI